MIIRRKRAARRSLEGRKRGSEIPKMSKKKWSKKEDQEKEDEEEYQEAEEKADWLSGGSKQKEEVYKEEGKQ